jgi:hypothetical protein
MSEAGSRVRWSPEELAKLANAMAIEMYGKPKLSVLSALRSAQDAVLPEDRRREVKAWSVVQPRLEALLVAAQDRVNAGVQTTAGVNQAVTIGGSDGEQIGPDKNFNSSGKNFGENPVSRAAEPGEDGQLDTGCTYEGAGSAEEDKAAPASAHAPAAVTMEVATGSTPSESRMDFATAEPEVTTTPAARERQTEDGKPAMNANAMGGAMAEMMESALLVALQSPQVEAAFAQMMGRAMARASGESNSGAQPKDDQAKRTTHRILVAGFPTQARKGIEDQLRSMFDVRCWNPPQGGQMLETLTRMCSVAVIPEDAEDEMSDELRGRSMQVVRHAGSAQRLAERLTTLLS